MNAKEYSQLLEIFNFLRTIQQLSYESTTLLKKFPIDSANNETMTDMLIAYSSMRDRTINTVKEEIKRGK